MKKNIFNNPVTIFFLLAAVARGGYNVYSGQSFWSSAWPDNSEFGKLEKIREAAEQFKLSVGGGFTSFVNSPVEGYSSYFEYFKDYCIAKNYDHATCAKKIEDHKSKLLALIATEHQNRKTATDQQTAKEKSLGY